MDFFENATKGCTLWDPWELHQIADFDRCMHLLPIRDAPTVKQVPIRLGKLSAESLCDFTAIVLSMLTIAGQPPNMALSFVLRTYFQRVILGNPLIQSIISR